MSGEPAILLLGRRDQPTDGVEDYCGRLRDAAAKRGLTFELSRVDWAEKGWRKALSALREKAVGWRDRWVFLQFTTLAWSRRGFPFRAPEVLGILRHCGVRAGVVYHDFSPFPGKGVIGKAREFSHARVLQRLYALSELCVFTVPVNKISWLPLRREKAIFIPVGSNFAGPDPATPVNDAPSTGEPTVVVFGITGGSRGIQEIGDISFALKAVNSRGVRLRLEAIGRGFENFEEALRESLNGSGIPFKVFGLTSAEEIVRVLANARVMVSVRGPISTRRGTVIAGMAYGLPIVGYRGEETGFPITEAGVSLVEPGDREGLVHALGDVMTDENVWRELRQRSFSATEKYFSWDAITSQFAGVMEGK